MYKRPEECKQHSKKLTKTKKKRKRTVDIEDECDDRGSDYPQGIVKKKLTPRNRYVSAIDKGIDKIKPSINVRDQYSNSRHIQCLTENSPLHPGLFSNFQEKSKTGKKLKDRGDLSTDSESSSHSEEICSFDSDIDLSGLTLTLEDQNAIVENYTKAHTSPTNTQDVDRSENV